MNARQEIAKNRLKLLAVAKCVQKRGRDATTERINGLRQTKPPFFLNVKQILDTNVGAKFTLIFAFL